MGQAVAKWVTISGIRRTSISDTLEVIVDCYTDVNPAGENGIQKVVFSRVVNGGSPTVINVTDRALHYPNHSAQASPIPGAPAGSMAPVWAYGITLDCGALAAGTIEVTAEVHSNAGTVTPLVGSIILYNDSDGTDRRPNQGIMYVDPVSGNDANNGQLATPKRSLRAAMHGLGGDLGGATIVLLPGTHLVVGPPTSPTFPYYTSGHRWLDVICIPGALLTRRNPYPEFMIFPESTRDFRIRFIGGLWYGDGMSFQASSGSTRHAWLDGGLSTATLTYNPAKPWTVLYGNADTRDGPFGQDGVVDNVFKYYTCHRRRGVTQGFNSFVHVQDCVISDVQGIYFLSVAPNNSDLICNVVCERHRYAENAVLGYIDVLTSGVASISVPVAGTMRVTATGTLRQTENDAATGEVCTFQAQCAELVGATTWGLNFAGFPTGNNGTFLVTAVGSDWVEVANPSAVASGAAPSGSRILTATPSGGRYIDVIHTDILQAFSGRENCLWVNISARDTRKLRGYVTANFGGPTLTRCALVNCHDGGYDGSNNAINGLLTDCFFAHNSLYHFLLSGATFAGRTNVIDNVCHHQTAMPTGGNTYIEGNHFITGTEVGLNSSSGDWYGSNDPFVDPWFQTPDRSNQGTASGLLVGPVEWMWPDSGESDSRGVWTNTGEHDWSVSERGQEVEAAVSAGVSLTVTGTAQVFVQASASAGVSMTVSGAATVGSAPPPTTGFGMWDVVSRTEVIRRRNR